MDEIPWTDGAIFEEAHAGALLADGTAGGGQPEPQAEAAGAATVDLLQLTPDQAVVDLREYLEAHRLLKLETVLLAHGVCDIPTLAALTEDDLREMGINKGPRVKVVRTVWEWKERADGFALSAASRVDTSGTSPSPRQVHVAEPIQGAALRVEADNLATSLFEEALQIAGLPSEPAPSRSEHRPEQQVYSDADIGRMLQIGFDVQTSTQALVACGGSLRQAVQSLI